MPVITPMNSQSEEEQQWKEILHTVAGMIILCISGLRELGELCRTSLLSGHSYVQELLNGHPRRFKEVAQMDHETFHSICGDLRKAGLEDTLGVTVEEAFLIFLFIVGDAMGNCITQEHFQYSRETIHW
jgi:hypothetical protein